jgi:serine/threonine-protein kinase
MGLFDKWLDEPQKRAGARPAPEAPARPGRERPAGERPVASGSLPSIAGVEMRKKTGDDSISEIYEGIHVFLARPVVVRILTGGARETSQHQDFVEWSKANARLVHPSILQVYDAGKVGDTYYAVSEMPEGAPLEAVMAREGKRKPLGVNLAIEIGIQLARALRRAHGEKVIHWDLRPSTVFISHERVARIGGFTSISHAARCAMNSGEMTSALPVHPYRAPELIHEVDIAGPSADIYGLSAVLYDMVCGRPPFVAESERGLIEAILRERPETPQKYNPTIPTEVCLVILKGLAKDPRNRHASAADLVRELKALQRMKSSGDEE